MSNFSQEEEIFLKKCALLNSLSEKDYNSFLALSSKTSFNKGDILLKEGEKSDDFFIIISGAAALYKDNELHSKKELITTLVSGETIGEMRVIQNRTCSLTVEASEPLVALHVFISQLHAVENKQCYESIINSIIQIINNRLYHSNEVVHDKIQQKKRTKRQLIFSLCCTLVLVLFLGELSFALYYAMNPTDLCAGTNSFSQNPKLN